MKSSSSPRAASDAHARFRRSRDGNALGRTAGRRHARRCQPAALASAPWTLTYCNPGGHSRGLGAGAGQF